MEKERFIYLLEQYRLDTATSVEVNELQDLLDLEDSQLLLTEVMETQLMTFRQSGFDFAPYQGLSEKVVQIDKENNQPQKEVPRVYFLQKWGWAAASVILLLTGGIYRWKIDKKEAASPVATTASADASPGRDGAILTLADGRKVQLDSLGNGVVAMQNGAQLVLKNGQLAYERAGSAAADIMYNTMTTPRGRQFQVVLPDGTKAWLNAASSITYPTIFTGKERSVKITGEVYLEVAGSSKMPFHVNVNDRAGIEVLGTKFNVNAYSDETSINTTLLEGSVKVGAAPAQSAVVLRPGQQAQIDPAAIGRPAIKVVDHADTEKAVAWKNGLFDFQGLTLGEVLRQLERWYDIRVQYSGAADDLTFWGKMYRNVNLSDVLDMLKDMGVKYRWEGNTLIIL